MGESSPRPAGAGTPGEARSEALQVTAAVIAAYAALTEDRNPIHLDPVFASSTPMAGVIAHGTLAAALVWQAALAAAGDPEALSGATATVRFRRPVRPGDRVEAIAAAEAGVTVLRVVRNDSDCVIDGVLEPSTAPPDPLAARKGENRD